MSSTMTSYSSETARASPSSPLATRSTPQRCSSKPRLTNWPTVGSSSITRIFIRGRRNRKKGGNAFAAFPPSYTPTEDVFNEVSTARQLRPSSPLRDDLVRRQSRQCFVVVKFAAPTRVVDLGNDCTVEITTAGLVHHVIRRVDGVVAGTSPRCERPPGRSRRRSTRGEGKIGGHVRGVDDRSATGIYRVTHKNHSFRRSRKRKLAVVG